MKVCVLASGSKGNCCYIETTNHKILVDLGISTRQVKNKLQEINIDIKDIDMLFFTHEHTDHIKGCASFLSHYTPKIYMSEGTLKGIQKRYPGAIKKEMIQIIKKDDNIIIDDLKIYIVEAFHDANEPTGFVFSEDDKKIVYMTDTGYIHQKDYSVISNASCYIFESNHDPKVLMMSNRPYEIKKRILSDKGHLSNVDSAVCLAYVIGSKTKTIIHAHISEECNHFELISKTFEEVLDTFAIYYKDKTFINALQNEKTLLIEV